MKRRVFLSPSLASVVDISMTLASVESRVMLSQVYSGLIELLFRLTQSLASFFAQHSGKS